MEQTAMESSIHRSTKKLALLGGLVCATFLPISSLALDITLSDGDQEISEAIIGDDLWVQASSASPHQSVFFTLWDDQGFQISSVETPVGPKGATALTLSWFRSGVVGCDDFSNVDPTQHRYVDFDMAESLLAGRVFEVRAETAAGRILETRSFSWTVGEKSRYFFSDLNACPRTEFENDETVYLSSRDAKPGTSDTTLYMVDPSDPVLPDGEIQEIRPLYVNNAQVLDPVAGAGDWTTEMWKGIDSQPGDYGAFVTHTCTQQGPLGSSNACVYSLGAYLHDGRNEHGIVIKDWSCEEDGCEDL